MLADGEMRSADHAVSRAVVERDAVAIDQVAIGKDDLAEEALQLIGRRGSMMGVSERASTRQGSSRSSSSAPRQ